MGVRAAISLMIGLLGRDERRRLSGSAPLDEGVVVVETPLGSVGKRGSGRVDSPLGDNEREGNEVVSPLGKGGSEGKGIGGTSMGSKREGKGASAEIYRS